MSSNNNGFSIGQRAYIRKQYRNGSLVSELCAKYGVNPDVIINIIKASQS